MKNYIKLIAFVGGGLALLLLLGWMSNSQSQPAAVSESAKNAQLVAPEENFDFGEVSMAAGKISKIFRIRNAGSEEVVIGKIYTSCMCTEASLLLAAPDGKIERFGPFGMPGHGFIPALNAVLEGEREAEVEVVFDPAAHGPAGIGRVARTVYLENSAGEPLMLNFTAKVIP